MLCKVSPDGGCGVDVSVLSAELNWDDPYMASRGVTLYLHGKDHT